MKNSNSYRRRQGEGCIHPTTHKGKIIGWRGLASYKNPVTGQQRRKSVSRKTPEEVEVALRELIRTLPKAKPIKRRTSKMPTLPSSTDKASVLAFQERDVQPTTYCSYVTSLQRIVPHLCASALVKLTVLDVEETVTKIAEQKGPRSARGSLRTLCMALRRAVRWQLLPSNAAEAVRKPKAEPRELSVWTPAHAERFLAAARVHRLFPLFSLALSTGMRKGELLGLS